MKKSRKSKVYLFSFAMGYLLPSYGYSVGLGQGVGRQYKNNMRFSQQNFDEQKWGGKVGIGGMHDPSANLEQFPVYQLSEQQKSDFVYMWQEEKMARDVYQSMFKLYGIKIFQNIAQSEQKHLEAMGALLTRYSLEIPMDENLQGEFVDENLQNLYNELLSKGRLSQTDALEVGKLIEVTDIEDLDKALSHAHPDAMMIYGKLRAASERHLSAFERWLNR